MHKVFISYHHSNEGEIKEKLLRINKEHNIFIDCSVSTGDIDENLEPQAIRKTIRRKYLSGSTVILLLVGRETKYRKHVDWELYSSMYNGTNFGRSGVVVLHAPCCESDYFTAPSAEIKKTIYPHISNWKSIDSRDEYEKRYPDLPPRIIDNLLKKGSRVSVSNWSSVVENPERLENRDRFIFRSSHNP